MIIGDKEYASIIIINKDNEVLAVIDDENIVEHDGIKVKFESRGGELCG